MKNLSFICVLFVLANMACQNKPVAKNDFSKCKFGAPQAIFSKTMPQIAQHQFELKNKIGTETVTFDSGKKLDLIQSGCNEIRQELTFMLAPTASDNWVELAASELEALGHLDAQLSPFRFWAGAIASQKDNFKLGQDLELEPKTFANIDRIKNNDYTLLKIILFQKG